ncbi:hypothetical protein ABTD83_21715, partial [Acinetobacter baumannii]
LSLSSGERRDWLKQHARIAECNLSYRRMHESYDAAGSGVDTWRADVPWSAIYLDHLETAAERGYSMDGLRFTLQTPTG